MKPLPSFQASSLSVPHRFFSRLGGVSTGRYDSLNGGCMTADKPSCIAENRSRMAACFGVSAERFLALKQVHGRKVIMVLPKDTLWSAETLPEADGFVTTSPDVVLTIATADCAPVLLSSDKGHIIGAAHAGWRGAIGGVLEETVQKMRVLGARSIQAAIGPCIAANSYEVSQDMRDEVLALRPEAAFFFKPLEQKGQFFFDLPGFCHYSLKEQGVESIETLALDTFSDPRFYSYRRSFLEGQGDTGRQISAIRVCSS